MARSAKRPWHLKPLRIAHTHVKLFAAAALGIVLFFFLPAELRAVTRALIAWNVAVALYLAAATYVIARFDLARVRKRAADEDEGAVLILVLTVAAAVASLAAIFVELGEVRDEKTRGLYAAHAVVTVVLSWFFIQVIFALHYAHEFYGEAEGGHKGGLVFPQDDHPDYWDFVYFSFGIATTFGATDVRVTSKRVRRVMIGHGVVAFFYNVAVLALMVSMGGDFVKGPS